jgi:subtilase family serine protease
LAAAGLLIPALTGSLYAQGRQRITQSVDNQRLVRLRGTTHPLATAANDRGRVAGELAMDRMLLAIKSSPEQETALEQLLAEQQDPFSPGYHEWLTPRQFGERFGASQQELDVIANWLQDHGFRVNSVAEGRRTIEFSGTARQVEEAFETEIHHYEVNGQRHVANATDIAIPEALEPVVGGIVSLHDFPMHPLYHRVGAGPGALSPAFNYSGGHAIGPYDFATIYNVAALWNLNYDGTGQTIAIAGHTNIKLIDVTGFRTYFGLPANNPQIIVNGADPGIISADEETEADLDVEWSGAVAKGATVKFVVSKSTNSTDGLDLSNQYIVNHNLASVMSLSFGACEADLGSENQFYNSLWSQAAAQGISVFVAAGDTGSAGCDVPVSYNSKGANITQPASGGLAVNGLASTPYNVAVGGTEFSDASGSYWNSAMDAHHASAKSYIPEVVWQESSYTTAGASGNNLYAGGGGVSSLYSTPAWQTGNGVPAGDPGAAGQQHHRYLPDVSLSAAGHDGYIVEQEGGLYLVGGTSVSSPSLAGIMAVINQYTGTHNGNPNLRLYPLAAQAPSVFHDVTSGTNAVPCAGGSPECSAAAPRTNIGHMNGYSAGAGYDLATGWGSVDAYNLASHWSNVTTPPAILSLSPNPMTGSNANQTLTIVGSAFQAGLKVVLGCTGATVVTTSLSGSTQIQASVNVGTTARTCTVQVVNLNGQASNAVSLQVVAPVQPPVIASVSPNPITGSSSNQTLTINGSGFQSGSGLTVLVGYAGYTEMGTQVKWVSASQITASINVGTSTRSWLVEVVNPNGQASNVATFQVNAPKTATR